eukprot:CAMPEP_0175057782 /NCGR_PEP_ID=MMETSP0052_2-20121109/11459_1 /TAXON_ID=51329 ORGANISM="Polytomella parva, Strain SAG 63-3" /NCGR_SAMPLE_ID=MMETSP0052_2 /ASSEMBLY_ACC=CAM_ASM_000194 /LENGTH=114 /DNA_ID=CAMNT_0016323041 /DNA_START=228 /DNA_END=572 /DNA_ORIENTATION=-
MNPIPPYVEKGADKSSHNQNARRIFREICDLINEEKTKKVDIVVVVNHIGKRLRVSPKESPVIKGVTGDLMFGLVMERGVASVDAASVFLIFFLNKKTGGSKPNGRGRSQPKSA